MEEVLSVPAKGEVLLVIVDALEVEVIVVHIIKCGSMDSIDQLQGGFRGDSVFVAFDQGRNRGRLAGLLPQELSQRDGQLSQGWALALCSEAAVEDFLQFGGHSDVFQFSSADEFQEIALLVGSGEGTEEQNYDHRQAEDIRPVIITFRGGLLRRTEQLRPYALAELLLPILHNLIRPTLKVLLNGGFPILGLPGQSKIDQLASMIADHHVMQFHVPVDDPLGVQVAQPAGDIQGHLVVLTPVAFGLLVLASLEVTSEEEALKVHLAQLAQNIHPSLLVIRQPLSDAFLLRLSLFPAPDLRTGFLLFGLSEDKPVGALRIITDHHLKLLLFFLFRHVCSFLFRKRLKFHPRGMVFQNLGMCQLGVDLYFCQSAMEGFQCLIFIISWLDLDYFSCVEPAIDFIANAMHLCKSPASEDAKIIKVQLESLGKDDVPAMLRFSNNQSLAFIINLQIIDGRGAMGLRDGCLYY